MQIRFKKYLHLLLSTIVLLSVSCEYEIGDYEPKKTERFLSIQASLSDQNEPQIVRLFYSAKGLTNNFISEPILKATVYMTDNLGKRIDFKETPNNLGAYTAPADTKGEIGKTYTLFVNTPDGKKYTSKPQTINGSPDISRGYSVASLKTNLPEINSLRGGYDVYIDFKDPDSKQFYRWSWTHYKRIRYCASCSVGWDFVGNKECRKPGRFNTNNGVPFKYFCSTECFDIDRSTNINVLNDALVNGTDVKKYFIKRIPYSFDDNSFPTSSYYLQVNQQSISEDAYRYYQSLQKQESQGTYFDVPALTQFSTNIFNVDDKSEKILGIFDAFSIRTKAIVVDRSKDIEGAKKQFASFPGADPCLVVPCPIPCIETDTRTKQRPVDWEKIF